MTRDEWTLMLSGAAIGISLLTLLIEFNIWLKARKTRKLEQKWAREDFEEYQQQRQRTAEQESDETPDRDRPA
jgi:hypothetical protein